MLLFAWFFLVSRHFFVVNGTESFTTLGTALNPFLHNMINSQQSCRIHLVFNRLSTKNLEHTANIAVTLSKLSKQDGPVNYYSFM